MISISPVCWTIDAYRSVLVAEHGFGQAVGMQLEFGALFAAVTLWAFRHESRKRATTACDAGAAWPRDAAIYGGCIRTVAAPPSEARALHRIGRCAPDALCAAL